MNKRTWIKRTGYETLGEVRWVVQFYYSTDGMASLSFQMPYFEFQRIWGINLKEEVLYSFKSQATARVQRPTIRSSK